MNTQPPNRTCSFGMPNLAQLYVVQYLPADRLAMQVTGYEPHNLARPALQLHSEYRDQRRRQFIVERPGELELILILTFC